MNIASGVRVDIGIPVVDVVAKGMKVVEGAITEGDGAAARSLSRKARRTHHRPSRLPPSLRSIQSRRPRSLPADCCHTCQDLALVTGPCKSGRA